MTKYISRGDTFRLTGDGNLIVEDRLPAGTYTVDYDDMSNEYFLKVIPNYRVGKLYGDLSRRAARIMKTYLAREASTGVLLSGEKGTGKTLLAKLLSLNAFDMAIPTVVINDPRHGEQFNRFIQSIDQPCVVIFDEFEKMYCEQKAQESMLTLLDGVYPTHKLFILTTNDRYGISKHMINRPGRLFYHVEYRGLREEFVREYCADNLNNKANIDGVLKVAMIFEDFSFDMMKALVEEMNRYDESARDSMELMNIKPDSFADEYMVEILVGGKKPYHSETVMHADPLKRFKVWYYVTKKDVDKDDSKRTEFDSSHITAISKGNYAYRNGNVSVKLSKKPVVHDLARLL